MDMDNSKYKILVVDDVEENVELLVAILSKVGYTVSSAYDGLSAIEKANDGDFDIILLDIMMPIMSGIGVCKYLKKHPKTASIPVIFLTASDDKKILTKAYEIGGVDYIKKPFFKEELLARVNSRLKLRDYEKNLEKKVEIRTKEIVDTQVKLMYVLGGIAEGHSKETQQHVKRVSEFTYILAKHYGLPEAEATLLKNAASLHDIGKIAVKDHILHKDGTLSKSEFDEIKKHAAMGADMLSHSKLPLFKIAAIVCLNHHEKWDGSGYPNALKGEDIHLYGRIVALADVFDALSFKRAYKGAWTQEEVLKFIKNMRGKHFDPILVDIFFKHLDDFLEIYHLHKQEHVTEEKLTETKKGKILDWLFKGL
jgi:putative two-component system response regulator